MPSCPTLTCGPGGPSLSASLSASELLTPALELRLPALELRLPALELRLPASELRLPALELRLPALELRLPASELRPPASELRRPALELRPARPDVSPCEGRGRVADMVCCTALTWTEAAGLPTSPPWLPRSVFSPATELWPAGPDVSACGGGED
jgi:hypothetical protein